MRNYCGGWILRQAHEGFGLWHARTKNHESFVGNHMGICVMASFACGIVR